MQNKFECNFTFELAPLADRLRYLGIVQGSDRFISIEATSWAATLIVGDDATDEPSIVETEVQAKVARGVLCVDYDTFAAIVASHAAEHSPHSKYHRHVTIERLPGEPARLTIAGRLYDLPVRERNPRTAGSELIVIDAEEFRAAIPSGFEVEPVGWTRKLALKAHGDNVTVFATNHSTMTVTSMRAHGPSGMTSMFDVLPARLIAQAAKEWHGTVLVHRPWCNGERPAILLRCGKDQITVTPRPDHQLWDAFETINEDSLTATARIPASKVSLALQSYVTGFPPVSHVQLTVKTGTAKVTPCDHDGSPFTDVIRVNGVTTGKGSQLVSCHDLASAIETVGTAEIKLGLHDAEGWVVVKSTMPDASRHVVLRREPF